MNHCLKLKNFDFTSHANPSPVLYKKSRHLKLSSQLNIMKLKNFTEFDQTEQPQHSLTLSPLKNIGLGVTERKSLPESSVCQITELSSRSSSKDRWKHNTTSMFYTKRKSSISSLQTVIDTLIERIEDSKIQTAEGDSLNSRFCATTYTCFRPTKILRPGPRKGFLSKKRRVKIVAKDLTPANCVSIQTEDVSFDSYN